MRITGLQDVLDTAAAVPEPPPGWYRGVDASGLVEVEVDAAAVAVRVRVVARAGSLGPAVLAALTGALQARLVAWSSGPAHRPLPTGYPATDVSVAGVLAARRELRELRAALAGRQAARTTSGAGGRVRVAVRDGQVVAVDVDPVWAARATDAEVGGVLADTLRRVLPEPTRPVDRALDGCPRLRALIDGGR